MDLINISDYDGKLVVDSRDVAEIIEKEHKNILRNIRNYVEILDSSEMSSHDFFLESTYINQQNKEQPCFLLTKFYV